MVKSNQSTDCFIVEEDRQKSILCLTTDKSILEEALIEEVRKRPPLYDYTLPLSVRGRYKLAELWKEISNALNGTNFHINLNYKIKILMLAVIESALQCFKAFLFLFLPSLESLRLKEKINVSKHLYTNWSSY